VQKEKGACGVNQTGAWGQKAVNKSVIPNPVFVIIMCLYMFIDILAG
jgi:hypothetical protein